MAFRDTLPLYDINSEFYKQILAFDALYAATLPPPPPKLVRQNAEEPRYLQLVAMEEGRPIAPYAPIKKAETSPASEAVTSFAVTSEATTSETVKPKKVRFIEPRRLMYESDDDPDDDMYV